VNRYDEMYDGAPHYFGRQPSRLVARFHHLIPDGARVLDIGVGQGRNALFLARRGAAVVGIDTSRVGLDAVRRVAESENIHVDLCHADVMEYRPGGATFDAVLAQGIVPVLKRDDVDRLFGRIDTWTKAGGLVFVTTFLTADARYRECLEKWEAIGRNSFGKGGRVRTFLEPGEIITLLPSHEVLYHHEGLGQEHRHRGGPPERHHLAELLAKKAEPL
jgi:cyclopropane fatty-acyl-phospholipid synthase-like methyltransferase